MNDRSCLERLLRGYFFRGTSLRSFYLQQCGMHLIRRHECDTFLGEVWRFTRRYQGHAENYRDLMLCKRTPECPEDTEFLSSVSGDQLREPIACACWNDIDYYRHSGRNCTLIKWFSSLSAPLLQQLLDYGLDQLPQEVPGDNLCYLIILEGALLQLESARLSYYLGKVGGFCSHTLLSTWLEEVAVEYPSHRKRVEKAVLGIHND